MPGSRSCPICRVAIQDKLLMCRTHWFRVPMKLRAEVGIAWQDYRQLLLRARNVTPDRSLMTEIRIAINRLEAAQNAAIASVRDLIAGAA